MANKTLKIKNLKQTIIISTDKKRQLVNKCGLPLRFKVPKGYTINKQAKRDNKLKRDKEIETAKQKAMQQIESEYESKHGVDTEETQRTNQAWSNLLKGL